MLNFLIITDIGCDADDIMAVIHVLNIVRQLKRPARIAFVLTMLNPPQKAKFLKHLMQIYNHKGVQFEIEIYLTEGYNTLQEATLLYSNFPPRFGDVYDQLDCIGEEDLAKIDDSFIFPVSRLSQFTDRCEANSIHLLVLSPLTSTEFMDFSKICLDTAHMMGGVAKRNGATKIGYNIGVHPAGFVDLGRQLQGKLTLVTTALCDSVRAAVDFPMVKNMIKLDSFGEFVFNRMMSWHNYITSRKTNFLDLATPCMSDLVAADVFLRAIFSKEEYLAAMECIILDAVGDDGCSLPIEMKMDIERNESSLCIDPSYTESYLDDAQGRLFQADPEIGTCVTFQEAKFEVRKDYATLLLVSVFAR